MINRPTISLHEIRRLVKGGMGTTSPSASPRCPSERALSRGTRPTLLRPARAHRRCTSSRERAGVVVGERVVDPDRPGLDFFEEQPGLLRVARVQARAEAVDAVVR